MLAESEQMRREADDTGPYAEFEHWRQLNARFNSVLEQIRSHECRMAIQILHISKAKIIKVTLHPLFLTYFHWRRLYRAYGGHVPPTFTNGPGWARGAP